MKKVMITLTLAAFTMMAQAQFSVGVRAGFNLTNMTEKYEGGLFQPDLKFIPGFQAGIVGEFAIGNAFAIQPGLLFATQGARMSMKEELFGETIEMNASVNLNYLQMPINAQLKLDLGSAIILLQAGPYLGYALSGKVKTEATFLGETEKEEDKIEFGSDEGKMRAFDFGVGFGAGVQFGNFQVGLGYNLGLANLSNQDGATTRNNGFALTATYLFGGGSSNHRR